MFSPNLLMKLISWEWIKMFWIRIYELIIDETLVKFIKQGTQQREKEGQKWSTQVWTRSTKTNKGHKRVGTNYVPKPSLLTRSISQKENEWKCESIGNLEKPSPTTKICFKIEVACILCKATNTLCR